MKSVSLTQIAEQLNISRITVSKVINDRPGVSMEMKKKVIEKLVECGYNKLTDSHLEMISDTEVSKNKCIAVVTIAPEFSDFWVKIINSISKTLNNTNYEFIYSILQKDKTGNYFLPKLICPKNISGIIVVNIYDNNVISLLENTGLPAVYLDTTPEMFKKGCQGDLVLLGDCDGIFKITDNLLTRGIKKIGFVGDITYSETIKDRFEGFKKAMAAHNMPINSAFTFTHSGFGHFYYSKELQDVVDSLSQNGYPEAIVCANDCIASSLIELLKQKGISVPRDMLISGYDNTSAKINGSSPLTTVNVDTDRLGTRLAKQIIMHVENPDYANELIYIQPEVIYRESTASL